VYQNDVKTIKENFINFTNQFTNQLTNGETTENRTEVGRDDEGDAETA
jgi:hypothetical protein